jgi:hypothetical protein
VLWSTLERVNWDRYRPAVWLITDLSSSNPRIARRAWNELVRRDQARGLSVQNHNRLIDRCLKEQASFRYLPLPSDMAQYLGTCFLAGRLSPDQRDQFLAHIVSASLIVRPKVVLGHALPYGLAFDGRGFSTGFWLREDGAGIGIDGKTPQVRKSGPCNFSGGIFDSGSVPVPVATPGPHSASITSHVRIYRGPYGEEAQSTLLREVTVPLKADFEVLPAWTSDDVKRIEDPGLAATLHECIKPKDLRFFVHWIDGATEFDRTPVNVAFKVYLRIHGKEYEAGSIRAGPSTCQADGDISRMWPTSRPADVPLPFTSCDVILRSSVEVARDTVNMFEIWDGELVYKDVPVKVETPATGPTQPADDGVYWGPMLFRPAPAMMPGQ